MNVADLDDYMPIRGYEGIYWINEVGVIRTVIRKGTKGELVKQQLGNRGYYYAGLTKDGKRKNHLIHRLIALHFIPNPQNLKYINHRNGIKTDNGLRNLEWCTSSDNNRHAYKSGLKVPHTKTINMKLSIQQIKQARHWVSLGLPKWAIADNLGVHRTTLYRALTERTGKML